MGRFFPLGALFGRLLAASWGAFKASWAVGGNLGCLGVIFWRVGALWDRLESILGPSWTDREPSWAPKKSSSILEPTLPGYFSSGDPQGPPRARELELLLTSYQRS